jgi:hypothetical protein
MLDTSAARQRNTCQAFLPDTLVFRVNHIIDGTDISAHPLRIVVAAFMASRISGRRKTGKRCSLCAVKPHSLTRCSVAWAERAAIRVGVAHY